MKLEVKNISKSFPNPGNEKGVLQNISFSVKEEEFVTLLGPSGCGKTTILTIIAGFQKQDAGTVLLNGQEILQPGPDKAFVFQNYALFPWKTVEQNILFPMEQMKLEKGEKQERLEYLLSISRLTEYRNYYPHQISGGMKQRNALVRALAIHPEVLLMDEPLGALDIEMREKLQDEIRDICKREKITVVMVTHDVQESVYLSDRVILMTREKGKILLNESIDLPFPRNRQAAKYKEYVDYIATNFKRAGVLDGSEE